MKRKEIETLIKKEAESLDNGDSLSVIKDRISQEKAGNLMPDISENSENQFYAKASHTRADRKRRSLKISAATAAIACVVVLAIALGVIFGGNGAVVPARDTQNTYISISVNPAVSLTVGADDKVTAVKALNAEAQVLILGMDLIGSDYASACTDILAHADRQNYLQGNTAVNVHAVNDDPQRESQVSKNVDTALSDYLASHNLSNPLQVNYVSAEAKDMAGKYGISAGKVQLIFNAELLTGKTLEELTKLDCNALFELNCKYNSQESADIQRELDARLDEIEREFEIRQEALEEIFEGMEDLCDEISALEDLTGAEYEQKYADVRKQLVDIINSEAGNYLSQIVTLSDLDEKLSHPSVFARELEEYAEQAEDILDELEDDFEDALENMKEEILRGMHGFGYGKN